MSDAQEIPSVPGGDCCGADPFEPSFRDDPYPERRIRST